MQVKFLLLASMNVSGIATSESATDPRCMQIQSLDAIRTPHTAGASLDCEEDRGLQLLHNVAREIECPYVIEGFTARL